MGGKTAYALAFSIAVDTGKLFQGESYTSLSAFKTINNIFLFRGPYEDVVEEIDSRANLKL